MHIVYLNNKGGKIMTSMSEKYTLSPQIHKLEEKFFNQKNIK